MYLERSVGPGEVWFDPEVQGEALRDAAWNYADSLWNSAYEVDRRTRLLYYAAQYIGRAVVSLNDFETVPNATPNPSPNMRTPRNLTRTLVDTAMSQFAKTETRTVFMTDGGTEVQQDQAQLRTDASNALITQTKTEIELRKAALHACVFDLGSVKFVETKKGPRAEQIFAWENLFDPIDGRRGKTIRVQRFTADKHALINDFAKIEEGDDEEERIRKRELADDIMNSTPAGMSAADHTLTDMHCVGYELWRLPVGDQPGRHIVLTDSALLLDEEWKDPTFPFVDFGWSENPLGIYPESIAAINSANQDELDGVSRRISQILRKMAVPRYKETGNTAGETTTSQIRGGSDEAIGDVIQVPPGKDLQEMGSGNVVGPELFQHEDRVWTRGFQMCGINESSAVGSRPAGLNSAPAQREWNEIRQDRLALVALQYQRAHVDAAVQLLEIVKRMDDYEITIKDPNGRWLKKVKASDLDLDASDYVIQPYPISALPTTPTGKLAAAADLLQMGAFTREEFLEIVQLPDLKSKIDVKLASRRAVEAIVGKMLKERRYEAPSERFDLTYALEYATAKWLQGIADGLDDDRMSILNDWIDEVTAMLQKKQAAAAPAGANPLAGTSIAPLPPQPLAPAVSSDAFGATLAGAS